MAARPAETESNSLKFGPAEADDLDALVSIDAGSPRPWDREAFRQELEHNPITLFALRSPGETLAFVVTRFQIPDMDIVNLAVLPGKRGLGLGTRLLSFLLDHAGEMGVQSVFLEVREGNQEARRLYRSAGFRETQRRPGFYLNPTEDAILMHLKMTVEKG
jgi:ribosomal-protein-alanine N-acetyltransferase